MLRGMLLTGFFYEIGEMELADESQRKSMGFSG
jgi:hypothetical protein